MKHEHYDIAIIGGGLAGLCLSIQMARIGYHVALFEKESYPFHKVCGEYIAMESWDFLEELGVPLSAFDLPIIKNLHISDCKGRLLKHKLNPGGFGISRYSLDAYLAKLAKKENVHVIEKCKVSGVSFEQNRHLIKTDLNDSYATIVCGSWGKRSNLDIKLNRNFLQQPSLSNKTYIAVKYHIQTDFPGNVIELHNFKDGYCGISKVDNDRHCLCYLTTSVNLQAHQNNIHQMEKSILHKNPFLNHYFNNSTFLYESPLTIAQLNFSPKDIINDHIFMTGDAGGLITPLCGNGMSMAMHSSKFLAEILQEFFKKRMTREQAEKLYTETWNTHFDTRLKAGRIFQRLFGKPLLTNMTIGVLRNVPTLTNKLVSLTHGDPF